MHIASSSRSFRVLKIEVIEKRMNTEHRQLRTYPITVISTGREAFAI